MGDGADDALDLCFDMWEEAGNEQLCDGFEPSQGRTVRCRYCGKEGLYWIKIGESQHKWRLYDADRGEIHTCGANSLSKEVKKTEVSKVIEKNNDTEEDFCDWKVYSASSNYRNDFISVGFPEESEAGCNGVTINISEYSVNKFNFCPFCGKEIRRQSIKR